MLAIDVLQNHLEGSDYFQRLLQKTSNDSNSDWTRFRQQWQHIQRHHSPANKAQDSVSDFLVTKSVSNACENDIQDPFVIESLEVDWLIQVFNRAFAHHCVKLVRGQGEPEYFPATDMEFARIEFAHGFFQSALHELSHWSLAGARRRTLPDFGYWYAPDGRNEAQQHTFEQVEIKPQAIECLFTLMCGKTFRVSQDNLDADFDTSNSTFAIDVFHQATRYINNPQSLPTDAQTLLTVLHYLCHDNIDK